MKIYPLQIFKIYNNYNPQIQANKPEFVITDLQHDIVSFGKKRNHKKEKTNLTEEEQLALIQQRKRAQFEFKNRVKEEKIKRIEAKKRGETYVSPFAQPKQKKTSSQNQTTEIDTSRVSKTPNHETSTPKNNGRISNITQATYLTQTQSQNSQNISKRETISPEEKLKIEHEKAKLKQLFINDKMREALVSGLVSEKKLELIINRLRKYPELLEELFFAPKGGDLILALPDEVMEKVLQNAHNLEKLVFSKDSQGRRFIEKAPTSKIIIFNEAAKNMPELLSRAYTARNESGQIPAHYLEPEALISMNEVLFGQPNVLDKIYTTTDKHGNTPAHNRFYASYSAISKTLKDLPATATKVARVKNNYGEQYDNAILNAKGYNGPYKETWDYILKNC